MNGEPNETLVYYLVIKEWKLFAGCLKSWKGYVFIIVYLSLLPVNKGNITKTFEMI